MLVWSIRAAVALYLVRCWIDLRYKGRHPVRRLSWLRSIWTVAGTLYGAHVLVAYHQVHHWSHVAAWEHTAAQTASVTTFAWGGGLILNHFVSLWWLVDIIAWWYDVTWPYRRRWYFLALHSWFGFMIFCATVIFGPSIWRIVALPVAVGLIVATQAHRTDNPRV